jgi:hypothetical protein
MQSGGTVSEEGAAVMNLYDEAIGKPLTGCFAGEEPMASGCFPSGSNVGGIFLDEPKLSEIDQAWLDDCFTYHAPTSQQQDRLYEMNGAAKEFARTILAHAPASADRSTALRLIREARMWANSAIVLEGRR